MVGSLRRLTAHTYWLMVITQLLVNARFARAHLLVNTHRTHLLVNARFARAHLLVNAHRTHLLVNARFARAHLLVNARFARAHLLVNARFARARAFGYMLAIPRMLSFESSPLPSRSSISLSPRRCFFSFHFSIY